MKSSRNHILILLYIVCLCFLGNTTMYAQESTDLDSVDISLLTCQPHEEVYSLYGHTAIRVKNHATGNDVVVNYGVFDQTKPYFVMRFILGLTDYTMCIMPMEVFAEEYRYYGSGVKEQVLNLSNQEKMRILTAIDENYRPENRIYRYNFYYNNCTTKVRNIIIDNLNGPVTYGKSRMQEGEKTFRELIHWKNSDYHWAAWGNDMLLGVGSDFNTTADQRQFLPEILMDDLENATVSDPDGTKRKLLRSSVWIIPHGISSAKPMQGFPLLPMSCATVILVMVLMLTISERTMKKGRGKVLDYLLFPTFGIIGLLLMVMVFSEHPTVRINLQILLFSPLWLLIMWKMDKNWAILTGIALVTGFFLGNLLQCYAEGANILALALLTRLLNALYVKNKSLS